MSRSAQNLASLQTDVERALGFKLASFVPLKEGSSPNYRAERASDGLPFLVKLLPPSRDWAVAPLLSHLAEMAGTRCVKRLFPEASEQVGDSRLICMEWCEGTRKLPHQLNRTELRHLWDDYLELSAALQRVTCVFNADPLLKWRERLLAMKGRSSAPLRRLVAHEVPVEEITYRPDKQRVIYGDFHHGNFVFQNGRVHRFFDLEAFSRGYPTEDIVRYFTCAFEHLPLGGFGYRRRLLAAFAESVSYLPYAKDEWLLALNAQLLRKCDGYSESELGIWRVANLLARCRLYVRMKRVVERCR